MNESSDNFRRAVAIIRVSRQDGDQKEAARLIDALIPPDTTPREFFLILGSITAVTVNALELLEREGIDTDEWLTGWAEDMDTLDDGGADE